MLLGLYWTSCSYFQKRRWRSWC